MLKRLLVMTLALALLSLIPQHALAYTGPRTPSDVTVGGDSSGEWTGRATWGKALKHGHKNQQRKGLHGHARTSRKHRLSVEQYRSYHGLCNRMNQEFTCTTNPKTNKPTPAAMTLNLTRIARTLITKIKIPDPTPLIGPDPSVNQWKMTAVGYPLWLWTTAPTTVVDRVRAYGVTFTLRATWTSTHFDMGDGHHLTCTRTQPYTPTVKPGTASPTCGYTYLKASLPNGKYTVSGTTSWRITWTALGMKGVIPASFTGSRQLPVGELNALVVG